MYVIQRHGKSKPTTENLKKFQFGYDYRPNVYGQHEGETLFINNGEKVVDITKNYLKTEFVDYYLNKTSDGKDVDKIYEIDPELTHGIVMDLQRHPDENDKQYDDAGKELGEVVTFGGSVINPSTGKYNDIELSINSVNWDYLKDLRNSLEQKALIVVDSIEQMQSEFLALAAADVRGLEYGVQFLVEHDANHNKDTWLYVVAKRPEGALPENAIAPIVASDNEYFNYILTPTIPLEYKFHDPEAREADVDLGKKLMLEVLDTTKEGDDSDENRNKVGVRFTKHTANTIVHAFEDAIQSVSLTCDELIGEHPTDGKQSDDTFKPVRGQTYQNYITLTKKVYNDDSDEYRLDKYYFDFNNFVLDEGTWDEE